MPSLERLQQTIASTEDLQSVVRTMKALAAVNVRQFEKASKALDLYDRTVLLGLRAVLRNRPGFAVTAREEAGERTGAVVYGTDQGMCGPLNETIVSHALKALEEEPAPPRLAAVGLRAANRLADEGRTVQPIFTVPGSPEAVTPLVQQLILLVERWLDEEHIGRIFLFHSAPRSGATSRPRSVRLLPLDRQWLKNIRSRPWPGNQLPWFSMEWEPLFAALMREYLYVSLYRAAVDSLMAENASRLAAMQGAESNIEDRLEALRGGYRQKRQTGITEELQDIISGFEALKPERGGSES